MIGESVTEKQLQDMLNLADVDKDGRINYEGEFDFDMRGGGGSLKNIKKNSLTKKINHIIAEFARLLS